MVMNVHVLIRKESEDYEGIETFIEGVYSDYGLACEARNAIQKNHRSRVYVSTDWEVETFKLDE